MKVLYFILTVLLSSVVAGATPGFPPPGGSVPGHGSSFPAPGGIAPSDVWGTPRPPFYGGWGPGMIPVGNPDWQNSGKINVISCGYDAKGDWQVMPLKVSYKYNGIQYDVKVLDAWDPWTDMWDYGVDVPAVNTSYYLRGNNYDFYVVLSTGTFYFNL